MKQWPVWVEGYAATGEHATAAFMGNWPGETFVDACRAYSDSTSSPSCFAVKDGQPSYWGCRFFDNEQDARAAFG